MYTYLHPPLGADEVHGLDVAAYHCYVLWRWLFDTLSVTLMRLSPDPQLHLVGIRWFLYLVVPRGPRFISHLMVTRCNSRSGALIVLLLP
jgi:hypothetical protein